MILSDVSIRRPVFAAMLVLGMVLLGTISLQRLEIQMDPDMEFPVIFMMTDLHGASPETVEREVTDVLEEHLNAIEGVRELKSISAQGLSRISIQFGLEYDVDVKAQEVRDKVALARAFLPVDVEDPIVQKFDLAASSVLTVVLGGSVGLREISDLAEFEVRERLERLPGVGGARVLGARVREVRIWLDPLRLEGYGLSIDDVAATLRRENAELASGRIEGARREWSVTTQGKAARIDDFGKLALAERGDRIVLLRDVAVVEDGMADARTIARLNGRPGVAVDILPQSGANIVQVARDVRAELVSIRERLPAGVEIQVSRDYPVYIEEQVRSVFVDIVFATLLVVGVVLFFLREPRSTLIAALAIPSSLIASFTLFYALGLSLNSMTLIALSLAVGLVIDDAIVVLESISRHVEQGQTSMRAAFLGSSQVGLAVVSTTLAVCAVFVPIAFMQSTVGRYFYEFGVVVTVAVCISTLVALTLTPMLASRLLRANVAPGPVFRAFARALDAMDGGYRRLLGVALRQRALTLVVGLAAVVGGCGVASTLQFDLYTESDMDEAVVKAKLPIGTPLPVTDRVLRRMEAALEGHPDVAGVFAAAGSETTHEPHQLRMDVRLKHRDERPYPIAETFDTLRQVLVEAVPEVDEISVGFASFAEGAGSTSKHLEYSLQGPELPRLERYSGQLLARMRDDPELVDASSSFESGRPQITLEVDRGRAAALGVSAVDMGRTIRTLLAGQKVGSYEDGARRYDVRAQVLPEYRDDPSRIDLIRVRSASGELVPISNVAEVRIGEGPVEIRRRNRTREIRLGANMAANAPLGSGTHKMEAWGRELGITAPDELLPGGRARTLDETIDDITFAFILALIALYMVLASLFDSLTHPITIMVSAPLSFIGGFVALRLAGMPMDMMSGIGLLVLLGLVMKNGILLVDYINQLRDQGMGCHEAILEAGPVRMRPVLMTSGALIFGMLPTVLSNGVGSEFRAPMAMITIGGLLTSTLLTLVVVPVVYSVVDRATEGALSLVRRLFGLGDAPADVRS